MEVDITEELAVIATEPRGSLVKGAIYDALDKLSKAGGEPSPEPSGLVTASLNAPYYIGITQQESPKGINLADVEYGIATPQSKSTFYFDDSYSPPRALMYSSQSDRYAFADSLKEATGFAVQRSSSYFAVVYPYDADDSPSGTPRIQIFYGSSNNGYLVPRILFGSSSSAVMTLEHHRQGMIYDSEVGYCTNGPMLFYAQNTSKTLLLLGIGTGTEYHLDMLFDKITHTIAVIRDAGDELHVFTEDGKFVQPLNIVESDPDNASLSPLVIPEIGLFIPDVYIASRFSAIGISRKVTFGDDSYISSGSPVLLSGRSEFVIKE